MKRRTVIFTVSEIAQQMRIPVSMVQKHIMVAIAALRSLDAQGSGGG